MKRYRSFETRIESFEKVGLGQWFRYLTGLLEVAGGVGLLIPRKVDPSAFPRMWYRNRLQSVCRLARGPPKPVIRRPPESIGESGQQGSKLRQGRRRFHLA